MELNSFFFFFFFFFSIANICNEFTINECQYVLKSAEELNFSPQISLLSRARIQVVMKIY